MSNLLVTGASGFLGSALIPKLLAKGNKVYALSRHPPAPVENLIPLEGDILKPNLGLDSIPKNIYAVYHLAAIHNLSETRSEEIWQTNVTGTENIIQFCVKYNIPYLQFCSTAFTFARNTYERSKMVCESMVGESSIPRKAIVKPSIIMGTPQHFYPGHFSQVVLAMIKVHGKAETIRRYVEGKLRLPILRPLFRLPGNPEGTLNLISINDVATAIANIEDAGVYWLTHDNPPKLKQIAEWLSEIMLIDLKFEPKFDATPLETGFQRMSAAFLPYIWGDNFKSDIKASPVGRDFIRDTVIYSLLKG